MAEERKKIKKFYNIHYDNLYEMKLYLERMARAGWMFEEVLGARLLFHQCEPAELNFAVEIFDKASEFSTFCSDENMEYIEYCEAAGWRHISTYGNLQFFVSEDLELTPIETDDRMKFQSAWRAGRLQRISADILLPLAALLNLFIGFGSNRTELLLSFLVFSTSIVWGLVLISALVRCGMRLHWRHRCLSNIRKGEKLVWQRHLPAKVQWALMIAGMSLWGILGIWNYLRNRQVMDVMITVDVILVFVLLRVMFLADREVRKRRVTADTNIGIQLALGLGMSFLIAFASVIFVVVAGSDKHIEYEVGGEEEILYLDTLPFYFDAGGNLAAQPEESDVEGRKKTGYYTDNTNLGKFLIEGSRYVQIPFDESGFLDEKKPSEMPEDKIMVSCQEYQSDYPVFLEWLVRWAQKGIWTVSGIEYDFAAAEEIHVGEPADYRISGYEREGEFHYLLRGTNRVVVIEATRELTGEALAAVCRGRDS